eukprot:455874_1
MNFSALKQKYSAGLSDLLKSKKECSKADFEKFTKSNSIDRLAMESTLKCFILQHLDQAKTAGSNLLEAATPVLDFALLAADKNLVHAAVVFHMVNDMLEQHTVAECEELFDHVEKRFDLYKKLALSGQMARLTLICACDNLRRRLPTARARLSGRMHLLLARVLAADEKSGANQRGECNVACAREYGDVVDREKEECSSVPGVDRAFYEQLWRAQGALADPASLGDAGRFAVFLGDARAIGDMFEKIPLSEDDARAHAESVSQSSSFFPKYRPSPRLLPLQLRDPSFRRSILLQIVFVVGFLLSESSKAPRKLSKTENSEASSVSIRAINLLSKTPPKGLVQSSPNSSKSLTSAIVPGLSGKMQSARDSRSLRKNSFLSPLRRLSSHPESLSDVLFAHNGRKSRLLIRS